jgi:hypothetical protein
MTSIKSMTMDAEQFIVDYDNVVWGQPETVVINKTSRTIRIIYKKKEGAQQKVEGCNFDEIVSFHVERKGESHGKYPSRGYLAIVLETTAERLFNLVPVGLTASTILKDDVVSDLFDKMDAYIPSSRQLPAIPRRLVTYLETGDGLLEASIKTLQTKSLIVIFISSFGITAGLIIAGLAIVVFAGEMGGYFVFLVLAIPLFLNFYVSEIKTITIDPERRQLAMDRCWYWSIRKRGTAVPFSDIDGFFLKFLEGGSSVEMRWKGHAKPIILLESTRDSAEASGLIRWLENHVPTRDARL